MIPIKQRWLDQFHAGGLSGPLCWYTCRALEESLESNREIRDTDMKVHVPTLFVGCDQDAVCRPELINIAKEAGLLPDLTVEMMDTGHWPMYEDPNETAEIIKTFLKAKDL